MRLTEEYQTGVTASTETVDLWALDTTAAFTLTVNNTPVNITAGDTAQDVADLINADDTQDVVASTTRKSVPPPPRGYPP